METLICFLIASLVLEALKVLVVYQAERRAEKAKRDAIRELLEREEKDEDDEDVFK